MEGGRTSDDGHSRKLARTCLVRGDIGGVLPVATAAQHAKQQSARTDAPLLVAGESGSRVARRNLSA